MEWHHSQCPQKGKFKVSVSRQDHNHCLVDCEGLILVDVVSRGERINSDAYVRTLIKSGSLSKEIGLQESNRYLAST
jgi:hypothetical protein